MKGDLNFVLFLLRCQELWLTYFRCKSLSNNLQSQFSQHSTHFRLSVHLLHLTALTFKVIILFSQIQVNRPHFNHADIFHICMLRRFRRPKSLNAVGLFDVGGNSVFLVFFRGAASFGQWDVLFHEAWFVSLCRQPWNGEFIVRSDQFYWACHAWKTSPGVSVLLMSLMITVEGRDRCAHSSPAVHWHSLLWYAYDLSTLIYFLRKFKSKGHLYVSKIVETFCLICKVYKLPLIYCLIECIFF